LNEDFAQEPEQLSIAVHGLVGEPLEAHQDPRGIFFIPSVAAPRARTYEGVVEEVGEGGVWGPLPMVLDEGEDGDAFGALLGNLLGQMPQSLLGAANAAAHGDPNALAAMGAQMQALMGSSPALRDLAGQLSGMLSQPDASPGQPPPMPPQLEQLVAGMSHGSPPDLTQIEAALASAGIDLSSPALQEMAESMQADLARDPAQLRALTERFLAAAPPPAKKPGDDTSG